jgi:hypothetical protein
MADASRERDFHEADAAVTRAVTTFVSELEEMFGRWEIVSSSYILESALLELSEGVSEWADNLKTEVGPATLRLFDALAAYRDAPEEDR